VTVRLAVGEEQDVIVGIDAGGSSTRARALRRSVLVHEGAGGPGNPLMAGPETIRASYQAALDGCPAATRVAACVSGGGGEAQRTQVAALLAERFPAADVRVAPDYVAAYLAAPPGSDVCVVAGTGSVVCSRAAEGTFCVSGGRGWILGDHGGAARLGQAALEHYVADMPGVSASFAAAVEKLFGDGEWRAVVRAVHEAANPAPLLASAAPLLTAAAENRQQWAMEQLALEMTALAATTARHIDKHVAGTATVRVALSGGVWSSLAARSAFTAALYQASDRPMAVSHSVADSLEGAVRLAESFAP